MTTTIPGYDLHCPYCHETSFATTDQQAADWCITHDATCRSENEPQP